jgi:hypothetical protein
MMSGGDDMVFQEPTETLDTSRSRWWTFWRSVPRPLRRRRARLSNDVDSDAASYWIRGGC